MITGLNHITLSVCDLERSFSFYVETLGFSPKARWESGAYLEAGNIWLALLIDNEVKNAVRPDYSHIAFSCDRESFNELSVRLETQGYSAWQQNKSEGDSYYFLDPDEHKLEMHVGDLQTRLSSMKEKPWADFQFFD